MSQAIKIWKKCSYPPLNNALEPESPNDDKNGAHFCHLQANPYILAWISLCRIEFFFSQLNGTRNRRHGAIMPQRGGFWNTFTLCTINSLQIYISFICSLNFYFSQLKWTHNQRCGALVPQQYNFLNTFH